MPPVILTTAHVAPFATALSIARVANLIENSWSVPTIDGTPITVPFIWVVALFLTQADRLARR